MILVVLLVLSTVLVGDYMIEVEGNLLHSERSVSHSFLSVAIDTNLATNPEYITFLGRSQKLRTLASGLSPAYLRFGGTKADFLIFDPQKPATVPEEFYWKQQLRKGGCQLNSIPTKVEDYLKSQWLLDEKLLIKEMSENVYKEVTITRSTVDMLYNFANCCGFHLIFGLNALMRDANSKWNSSNAKQLLNYCASKQFNMSWELGNEPNSYKKKAGFRVSGTQLGEDFLYLHKLLSTYSSFKHTGLFGPDVGQPKKRTKFLLEGFLKKGGKVIDAVTWHHYYLNGREATKNEFLSPEVLDSLVSKIQEVFQVVNETVPGKKVWLGETSSAFGGGAPKLSDTYAAGFMWLDKLGLSAKLGINVVIRQVLFGAGTYHLVDANFDPLPDYWLSLAYKKLVGPKVLQVRVSNKNATEEKKLRVYLHCTNSNNPDYVQGSVTLFALNLDERKKGLHLCDLLCNKTVDQYLLEPFGEERLLSKLTQLNGQVLRMVDDKTLPDLKGKTLSPGKKLILPAFSYGFFVIKDAKAPACI
uniref:Heparanase n=1 Tax=Latimeria chalumnae TaxID=7897 RepID=H3APX2_LATCH